MPCSISITFPVSPPFKTKSSAYKISSIKLFLACSVTIPTTIKNNKSNNTDYWCTTPTSQKLSLIIQIQPELLLLLPHFLSTAFTNISVRPLCRIENLIILLKKKCLRQDKILVFMCIIKIRIFFYLKITHNWFLTN